MHWHRAEELRRDNPQEFERYMKDEFVLGVSMDFKADLGLPYWGVSPQPGRDMLIRVVFIRTGCSYARDIRCNCLHLITHAKFCKHYASMYISA